MVTSEKEVYFSVDIEANGPIPGEFSMLSLGVVAYSSTGKPISQWTKNFQPLPGAKEDQDTMEWFQKHPAAFAHCLRDPQDPGLAIKDLSSWIQDTSGIDHKPVAIASPVSFDATYLVWYFSKFLGHFGPFKLNYIDARSVTMGLCGGGYRYGKHRWIRKILQKHLKANPMPHCALTDAWEQGDAFFEILKAAETHKNG